MKTAYQLAMEKLEKNEGKRGALSPEKKRKIAEIDSQATAKIAEIDIMMSRELADARAAGDAVKISELEQRKVNEVAKLRSRAETDKKQVRGN